MSPDTPTTPRAPTGPASASGHTPRVLLLFPGVQYDLEHNFRNRLERLSAHFRGGVFAPGDRQEIVRWGDFTVATYAHRPGQYTRNPIRYFRQGVDFARHMAEKLGGIDLIVTYDPLKSGLLGAYLARELGAKLVTEVNGDFLDPHIYADIRHPAVRRAKQRLYPQIMRQVLRRADGVKLLFPGQLRELEADCRKATVEAFPDFCDTEAFYTGPSRPVILFAGFPYQLKGVDMLIRAFQRVADDFPEWRLRILGWFPDRAQIEADIDGHPRIDLVGPVPRADMPAQMAQSALFVLPSRSEAMGRVLIEAMAAGKPRIGSRVGGIPTLIDDGRDGLLVAPGAVDELADALRELLADEGLRERMGARARARYEEELTLDAYFERLRAFYSRVLNQSGSAQAGLTRLHAQRAR